MKKRSLLIILLLIAGLLLACDFSTKAKEVIEFSASLAAFCFLIGGYGALIAGAHVRFYKFQNKNGESRSDHEN